MKLFKDQEQALELIKLNRLCIVCGGPGTGKSTVMKEAVDYFKSKNLKIAQCAPSGKAAKRLSECTGMEAKTIHSLLQPLPVSGVMQFQANETNPLDVDVVICDESSMIDEWLMASLLRAIKPETRLILVGDTYQLPSVGAGNVLGDLIDSEIVPVAELTEIKRQQPGLIITNCHKIKNGVTELEFEDGKSLDFLFIESDTQEQIYDRIRSLLIHIGKLPLTYMGKTTWNKYFAPLGKLDVLRDIQVISPLREKTDLSVKALNNELQKLLNKNARFAQKDQKRYQFFVGDKVIQKKNEYDLGIINGDIGFIREVDFTHKEIVVQFGNPERTVSLPLKDNNLELAYALTCHSMQGSEAPVIIIPIHPAFGGLIMQRNWLYTAISRAKQLCIMVGHRAEVGKIIARNRQQFRYTQLAGKINPEIEEW